MKSLHPPILISKKNILIHELTDQYVSFIFRTLCFQQISSKFICTSNIQLGKRVRPKITIYL